jgi:disulfide oxidoreductase YuzD
MHWHGLRIPVILLALVVGLSIFFGSRWLYNKFGLEEPLGNVLTKSKAVQSFEINRSQPVTRIIIYLAPVNNLKETYQELNQQVQSVLGSRQFEIKLIDRRDEKLTQVLYHSQFAIYEAIKRGNYQEMVKFIEDEAVKTGATATVYLDQKNIYLQIQDNDHYLYEIIPHLNSSFRPTEKISFSIVEGNQLTL